MGSSLSDLETDPAVYSLIFDGLLDESPEALQRLKGVFIADLDLTVPEVQAILENGKGIVCTGEHESDLDFKLQILKELGAAVYVVGPQSEAEESASGEDAELAFSNDPSVSEESDSLEEEDDEEASFSEEAEEEFEDEEDEEEYELEFSLDEMLDETPAPKKKRSTVHVIDEETSLDDTLNELGIESNEPKQELALDSTVSEEVEEKDGSDVPFVAADVITEQDNVQTPENSALDDYKATGIESEDSLFGEPVDPQTGKLESSSKAPVGGPKVNKNGVIPESAIAGELSFELTSMDDETPTVEKKTIEEPVVATSSELEFTDLALQPEIEDALIDTSLSRQSEIEDVDLSLNPEPIEDEDDELSFSPDPAEQSKRAKPVVEETSAQKETSTASDSESAGNALFSGVDLDSMLDSVADVAARDLDEAGVEAASDESLSTQTRVKETKPSQDVELSVETPQPTSTEDKRAVEATEGIALEEDAQPAPRPKKRSAQQSSKHQDAPKLGQIKTSKLKAATVESVAEEAEELLDDKPTKPRKESKIPLDVAVIVVLGAAILFAGNWYYVSQSKTDNDLERSRIKMEILKIQKEAKLAEKARAKEKVAAVASEVTYSNTYEGQLKEGGVLSKATAVISDTTVELAEFVMRGPKPRALSDMEIIEGKVIDPWLSKVAVDPVTLTLSEESSFSREVPLKVFVSDQGKNDRFHSKGILEGSLDREARTLSFSLYVKEGGKTIAADTGSIITRATNGFAYAIKGKVVTQALPEEKKK